MLVRIDKNRLSIFATFVLAFHLTLCESNFGLNTGTVSRSVDSEWPVHTAKIYEPGDILIGGLMMVHERDDVFTCGPIMPQGGLQALEAMLFTVDVINNSSDILPDHKLGVLIKDDCDSDTYGLEQSLDFIKERFHYIGMTSIQLASVLKLFKVPQVSFFSTSPQLSNKDRFPYFMRTIPSDINQAEVMVELVKKFKWKSINVIYEESSYGMQGFSAVEMLLKRENICIVLTERLMKDSGVASAQDYDVVVSRLKQNLNVRGVIVFASDQEVAELMSAVERANVSGVFSWVGSDGWGGRTLVSNGHELAVEGAVTVQPLAEPIHGFAEYFRSLTPYNHHSRNPWFSEYWQQHFKCQIKEFESSTSPWIVNYTTSCDPNLRLMDFDMEAQLQYVSDAVYSFAKAFDDYRLDHCKSNSKCPLSSVDGPTLRSYLRNVNFVGLSGETFRFKANGDGPAYYRILNFRQVAIEDDDKPTDSNNSSSTPRTEFKWISIGFFRPKERLTLDIKNLQFTANEPKHPPSSCSPQCSPSQAQKFVDGNECCWTCINCTTYEILGSGHRSCVPCPNGKLPNVEKTKCVPILEEYLRPNDLVAIIAEILAALGILAVLFVLAVMIRFRDTPVVRASSRELSYALLTGILGCYLMTFLLIMRPSNVVCLLQQFFIGFFFTVCCSAILVKTNRIDRIFRSGRKTKKAPRFISPLSSIVIFSAIVSVQVAINIVWMIISPSAAVHYYPSRDSNQLICKQSIGVEHMIAFFFPLVLVLICTVYAVLTRKIPAAFNESKYIGFTMYTTCVIWLAFVPVYFATGRLLPIRQGSLCFSVSFSATVALLCLFMPKVRIIVLHPELNVKVTIARSVRYSPKAPGSEHGQSLAVNSIVADSKAATVNAPYRNSSDSNMHIMNQLEESRSRRTTLSANDEPLQLERQPSINAATQTPSDGRKEFIERRQRFERQKAKCQRSDYTTTIAVPEADWQYEMNVTPLFDRKISDGSSDDILL